ncbi:hypothetical protein PsorP6_004918 [Peronosclerospora sorghi]|uniref:Uncharacterized protein n=1 Tax=Peronosclerospora sorghi TaxID=230839 RepID=A0ACC0W4T7_9STRA|nr:hypothetical protein PsorP6_004918 [Peronosclerospora sorghi]
MAIDTVSSQTLLQRFLVSLNSCAENSLVHLVVCKLNSHLHKEIRSQLVAFKEGRTVVIKLHCRNVAIVNQFPYSCAGTFNRCVCCIIEHPVQSLWLKIQPRFQVCTVCKHGLEVFIHVLNAIVKETNDHECIRPCVLTIYTSTALIQRNTKETPLDQIKRVFVDVIERQNMIASLSSDNVSFLVHN